MDTDKMLLNAKTAEKTENALLMEANVNAADENGKTALFLQKPKNKLSCC